MKTTLILIMAFLTGLLSGCGEDDELVTLRTDSSAIARKRVGDLTFTLQILNMQDKPQAVFQEGENFQFEFIIENTGSSIYQLPVYWYFPITDDEFFALYRKTQESRNKVFLGKSFQGGANTNDASIIYVPDGEPLIYRIPWYTLDDTVYSMPLSSERKYIKPENKSIPSLKSGEYFTGFTIKYSEADSARMEVSFSIE